MAVPRIPHDVIFLTGGWQNRPVAVVETYDTRGCCRVAVRHIETKNLIQFLADRWVNVPQKPDAPRCYHGTAVIGTLLYLIGGFDGRNFFNTCSVFDAANKIWREVGRLIQPTEIFH